MCLKRENVPCISFLQKRVQEFYLLWDEQCFHDFFNLKTIILYKLSTSSSKAVYFILKLVLYSSSYLNNAYKYRE